MNENVGEIVYVADIDTGKLKSKSKTVEQTVENLGDKTDKSATRGSASFLKMGAAIGAISGIATAVVNKGINLITNSIGAAVRRSDTLKNATRNFQNMGFTAEDTSKTMDALKKSILGLPTPLDAAVRGMQLITSSTNDIGKSQKIFAALNNGILGFGGSVEMVDNAIIQLSQAFSNGRIDAQSWNSLINSGLGPALNAIAKQMGITTGALKEGLSTGKISVKEFQDRLIALNEKGGGGLASLEKIAKDSTSGIGTSFSNMQTSIVRGVTAIIETIGAAGISGAINKFGEVSESALKGVAGAFSTLVKTAQTEGTVLNTAINASKESFAGLSGQIDMLNKSMTEDATTATALGTAWKSVAAVIGATLLGAVVVIGYAVQGVTQVLTWGVQSIRGWIDLISSAMAWMMVTIDNAKVFFNGFFRSVSDGAYNLVNRIRTIFSNIGTNIGNAVGNAFSGAVNGILGFLQGRVNAIIDTINAAIGAIDKITPGSLPRISRISIPRLADGGIVKARPGGIMANIGEGGEDEAVIPLSKLDKMMEPKQSGNVYNITVNAEGIYSRSRADERAIAANLVESLNEQLRAQRLPQIGGGNLAGGLIQ